MVDAADLKSGYKSFIYTGFLESVAKVLQKKIKNYCQSGKFL